MLKPKSIILSLTAALIFFTPLIFVTNTNELYEFPKMYFVYFLGTLIIFLFLVFRILYQWGQKINLGSKYIWFYVLSFGISTLFSNHFYTSLWGYYTRFNGGLLSVLVFLGLFIVFINTFEKQDYEQILKVLLLTIVPIGIYGIFQHFNSELRAYSTFGQPNWLAAFLSMLLPITLLFSMEKGWINKLWGIVYLIGYTCFWFCYSVSGFLGLTAGIFLISYLNRNLVKKNIYTFCVLIFITILISIFNLGVFRERIMDVLIDINRSVSSLTKVYAQVNTAPPPPIRQYNFSDPGFIRTGLWRGTLELALSSPKIILVGTGPETFPYEFPKFRVKDLNYSSEWDFIFNKPHNYYLEVFSQLGILGLVAYLLVIDRSLRKLHPIVAPALTALYITNFFGWPTVATAVIFWFFLSYLEAVNGKA